MNKYIFAVITFICGASNGFAFEVSDLNGTWTGQAGGIGIEITISGLPSGETAINEVHVANVNAIVLGISFPEVCDVKKIEENKFESLCNGKSRSDHNYIQFLDQNTLEDEDLMHGYGKTIEKRKLN